MRRWREQPPRLMGQMCPGMIVWQTPGPHPPPDWDGGHCLMNDEGGYLRNPGDYHAWERVFAYTPRRRPSPAKECQ